MKRILTDAELEEVDGIVSEKICALGDFPDGAHCLMLEDDDIPKILPKRSRMSHKGTCGKVLAVAGSPCMAGAAAFCGESSYRAGAGLVKILTARENLIPLQCALPEALYQIYDDYPDPGEIRKAAEWADVVLIGPGLGQSEAAKRILKTVTEAVKVPMVFDADALNIIASSPGILSELKAPAVITPHLGEMSRLTGKELSYIRENMIKTAKEFADKHNVTVLLKSAVSVIAEPSGRIYINNTGNDALSKGGSGDILSGFVAGLLAGDSSDIPVMAAAAAYLCGKNAEHLSARMSSRSVMARDLLREIGEELSYYGK